MGQVDTISPEDSSLNSQGYHSQSPFPGRCILFLSSLDYGNLCDGSHGKKRSRFHPISFEMKIAVTLSSILFLSNISSLGLLDLNGIRNCIGL
jgi:hypothetical protein